MELGLSLGESTTTNPRPQFGFLELNHHNNTKPIDKGFGFCMGLGMVSFTNTTTSTTTTNNNNSNGSRSRSPSSSERTLEEPINRGRSKSLEDHDPPIQQLDLLPLHPVLSRNTPQGLNWPPSSDLGEVGSSARGFDVNQTPCTDLEGDAVSSPNSTVSSFQIDFSIYSGGNTTTMVSNHKRDADCLNSLEAEAERASSRASDEEENGLTRKKLRLSKEQSAYLEESFKEHNTLNPQKQKLALAKQLNLRPRQVEVWFQNRRARTKLKQTEVDCEYLKRCCETLTDENRRLQKELQELRALKTSHPYYMQLPATTLTMCPSCERVAATTTTATASPTAAPTVAAAAAAVTGNKVNGTAVAAGTSFSLSKSSRLVYPFSQPPPPHLHHQSAAS
ncbi:hypothetical protein Syun_002112 [Stephania yunnanensis]|uniref:Homeobox domain-containing protein n=1 Tax=Stephania yunnanensis TaxID=152371 RepID=A0AAP0Q6W5_9MAGN